MDITQTIQPKSDQLNADDLIAAPMTITVTSVTKGSAEQPVNIHWQGGEGRPYKPSKSMRRVIATAWGVNSNDYIGRSMTLFREPGVRYAGQEVGGIRISHMSHIDKPIKTALTVARGKREPYTVQPLAVDPAPTSRDYHAEGDAAARAGVDSLRAWWKTLPIEAQRACKDALETKWKPMSEQSSPPVE